MRSVFQATRVLRNVEVPGFVVSGVECGIKKRGGLDFALLHSKVPCAAGGVFTRNKFAAAPVQACKDQLKTKGEEISTVMINSGCANACTGDKGLKDAHHSIEIASSLGLKNSLVMSTGVIGPFLDMNKIEAGLKKANAELSAHKWDQFAKAIMTTDTSPKLFSKTFNGLGKSFTIAGISKGAGMIHPNMATMLGVVGTDFNIAQGPLQEAVKYAADRSFNSISIDGDTSTNDSFVVLANGLAGNQKITSPTSDAKSFEYFRECLTEVAIELAQLIVKDGEGVTKFVTVLVEGARSYQEAREVATSICRSCLVKTAFFGQDANWGRIVCSVGYSGVDVDPTKVNLWFGRKQEGADELHIFKDGSPFDTNEEKASSILKESEFRVRVHLGLGKEAATMWTCDLSDQYVHINADYRS